MAMTEWPSAADVSGFLAGAGYAPILALDLDGLVSRAVGELESTVGFSPFLAGEVADTRQSAVSGTVVLDRLFARVTSVTAGGAEMGFTACPQAVTPIRRLALADDYTGEVTVTGKPGFGETIPFDIWYAVRDLAAAFVVEMVAETQSEGIESVKQDSVTLKYRQPGGNGFAGLLMDRAQLVFARYRLVGMGG